MFWKSMLPLIFCNCNPVIAKGYRSDIWTEFLIIVEEEMHWIQRLMHLIHTIINYESCQNKATLQPKLALQGRKTIFNTSLSEFQQSLRSKKNLYDMLPWKPRYNSIIRTVYSGRKLAFGDKLVTWQEIHHFEDLLAGTNRLHERW